MKLPISLLLGAIVAGKIILLFLCWLVWRTYRRGFGTSQSRMLGLKGEAITEVAHKGRVMVQGEYWWARSRAPIAAGEAVRVIGIDGLWLEVELCPDKEAIPRPVSAVISSEAEIQ